MSADPAVEAFISGGPYLYAGFGSMAIGDASARGRAIVEAARAREMRVLIATGLGGIAVPVELAGDDVLVVRSVDHAAVLPSASAAIHHGGVGTVHAAARAGVPSIVVPFIADQPFWGAHLHRVGLAPAPIPQQRFTRARLGTALDAVGSYRQRNREVSTAVAAEDGIAVALALVESLGG